MDIITYLNNNRIYLDENYKKENNNKINYFNQLDLIVLVQNKLINNKITFIPRINSTIGKELENFKLQIKKLEIEINSIKKLEYKRDIDIYIVSQGTKILERAKKSINSINKDEYYEIIKRSMRNYEICLGRVDGGNLKIDYDGNIKIRTIKYVSYNLIEQDIFNYIKRIKRLETNIPIVEIIDVFINKAALVKASKNYLVAINNYPLESMKVLCKYSVNDRESYEEWVRRLELAIKIDGDELI